jgi:hypothetical protein
MVVGPHLAGALLLAAYGLPNDEPRAKKTTTTTSAHITARRPPPPLAAGPTEPPKTNKPARTMLMHLEHGEPTPDNRPNTWVHIPATRDRSRDLRVTFLFHGFKNCIESYTGSGIICSQAHNVVRPGYQIAAQLERAGSKSIVVIPETSFDVMSSEAPDLAQHGAFRKYVDEVLDAIADETGGAKLADVSRLALSASSGGYQALEPILDDNTGIVTDVILMDAAYMFPKSAVGRYLRVAATELAAGAVQHRIGILYTRSGGALPMTEELMHLTEHALESSNALDRASFKRYEGDPSPADMTGPLWIHYVHEDHDVVVRRNLGKVIAAAGL